MKYNSSKSYFCFLENLVKQYKKSLNMKEFTYLKTVDSQNSIFDTLLDRLFMVLKIFVNENFNKEIDKINPLFEIDTKLVKQEEFLEAEKNLFKNLDWIPSELLTITVRNYDRLIHSFNDDFIKNKNEIEKTLFDGRQISEIFEISSTSASGFIVKTNVGTFVYKNHDCRNDVWFHNFLEHFFPGCCYSPKCWADNDTCGFCEYIAMQFPVKDEINTYCKNLGIVASISTALGLSDLHSGNVLPIGTVPVIIDLEMLFKPLCLNSVSNQFCTNKTDSGYYYYLNRSVLGQIIVGGDLTPFKMIPNASLDSFIEGFSFGYDKLLASKEKILKETESAASFHERFVLRKHDYYQTWIYKLNNDKKKRFENRIPNVTFPNKDLICSYEQFFLKQGIDPYFYTLASSKDLYGIEGQILINNFFLKSSLEMVKERIGLMSEDNKQFEITLIKNSFDPPNNHIPENDIDYISYWEKRLICAPNGEKFWIDSESMHLVPNEKPVRFIIAEKCSQIAANTCDNKLRQRAERLVYIAKQKWYSNYQSQ